MTEYRLFVVRYGTRTGLRSEHFFNHRLYGEPDAPMDIDYFFWILVGAGRTVVVDCGYSAAAGDRRGRPTLITPGRACRDVGVDPERVDVVVLTHAHYDHAGNLDLFPRARVVIAASDLAFWRSDVAGRAQLAELVEAGDLEQLRIAEEQGRLETFTGRAEPAPGVVVTEVGGHSPGQSVVELDTSAGPVLLTSDAVHFHEELERDMPFRVFTDLPGMYRGYDEVRRRAAATGAMLITGHDPATTGMLRPVPCAPGGWIGVLGDPPDRARPADATGP